MTKSKILNSNQLKLIAIIAMTVDHIAWAMFDGYPSALLPLVMHIIGRLTCPIMCYFIAEGYHYTRNIISILSDYLLLPLFHISLIYLRLTILLILSPSSRFIMVIF